MAQIAAPLRALFRSHPMIAGLGIVMLVAAAVMYLVGLVEAAAWALLLPLAAFVLIRGSLHAPHAPHDIDDSAGRKGPED